MKSDYEKKNIELINDLSTLSNYYLDRLPGGDKKFLCIENENLISAHSAILFKDTRILMIFGIDEEKRFVSNTAPVLIFEDKLYDYVAEAVEDTVVLGVIDKGLATILEKELDSYSINCEIADRLSLIKSLEFIDSSYSSTGFKFGVTLENGVEGEIVVGFGDNYRDILYQDIEEASCEMRKVSKDTVPGFEDYLLVQVINIGGFDIVLDAKLIAMLHLFSSISVELK